MSKCSGSSVAGAPVAAGWPERRFCLRGVMTKMLLAAALLLPALASALNVDVELVSRAASGDTAGGASPPSSLSSADGRYVVFASRGANLIDGLVDLNGVRDVFLFDRVSATMTLVSRALGAPMQTPNGASEPVAISANGNWVLFKSSASDVVADVSDTNLLDDVFLFERATGVTTLVSRAHGATAQTANSMSSPTAISADGNWVLFRSLATNLVAGVTDSNGAYDVFLFDRVDVSTMLVSRALGSAAQAANGDSQPIAISADGNRVVYTSQATDLIAGLDDSNGSNPDVFLFDRAGDSTTLVSRALGSATQTANDSAYATAISADGSTVLFYSFASNVIGGLTDINGTSDAFVFDLGLGSTTLISRALGSATQTAGGDSFPSAISADGSVVLFVSNASDLISGVVDANGDADVFMFDRNAGSTILVSRALGSATQTPNDASRPGALSADGNWVLFGSVASNVISGVVDNNGPANDVFLFNRVSSATTLVSRALGSATQTANAGSQAVALSASGDWALLQSSATNLINGIADNNGVDDVFLFERASAGMTLVSRAQGSASQTANNESAAAAISADGNLVLFRSRASDVIGGITDGNSGDDVFLRDRAAGTTILVSRALGTATQTANAESLPTAMTADGNFILYKSRATDIIPGVADANDTWDVFLFERASGLTTLVSRALNSPTQTAAGESSPVAISADGGRVLFYSSGSDLIGGVSDANDSPDVFLFDRASGSNTLVSRALGSPTQTANGPSIASAISANGNFVAFYSSASNVVAGVSDNNGSATDVYLYNHVAGGSTLVSRALDSPLQTPDNASRATAISADGNWVLFQSDATNLIAGVNDSNGSADVFVFDRVGGAATLVSRALGAATATANGISQPAAISADGTWILFGSNAANVINGVADSNNDFDVFLFNRASSATLLVSRALASPIQTPSGRSIPIAGMTPDASRVLYSSTATDVIGGVSDGNGAADVFLFDRPSTRTTLVSRALSSATQTANGLSVPVAISASGATVLFDSRATDLVAGVNDGNAALDVFVADVSSAEATSIQITSDLPDPSAVGQTVLIEVAVNGSTTQPTDGQVTINASTGETCSDATPVSGGGLVALFSCSITFNSSGLRNLIATYSDSAIHGDSTSAIETHQVQQPTITSIVSHVPGSTVVGEPYVVTVNVAALSQSPQGAIVVRDGTGPGSASCGALVLTAGTSPTSSASCTLTSITAGLKTLTAEYIPSSAEFGASISNGVPHQVNPAATSISVVGPPRSRINQPTTFTFALSVDAPGAGAPVGVVTLSSSANSCSVNVPTATPSCALTFNVLGPRTISAAFVPSDGNYLASSSSGAGNAQTLVYALSDIAVTKSDGAASYNPGDLIVYTVTVRNLGPDTAMNIRIRDDVPTGLINVVWSCDASGGAICPQAGGNGNLDVLVPSLVNGGLLTFTFYGTVDGSPGQIVNIALVELPADTTVEDPQPGNNSASDTNVLDELFRDGFESPAVNAPMGNYRLPDTALRGALDTLAIVVYTLDDADGEALRVYARVHDDQMQYALALRGNNGALRLSAWVAYSGEPTLTWHARASAAGWVLDRAELLSRG